MNPPPVISYSSDRSLVYCIWSFPRANTLGLPCLHLSNKLATNLTRVIRQVHLSILNQLVLLFHSFCSGVRCDWGPFREPSKKWELLSLSQVRRFLQLYLSSYEWMIINVILISSVWFIGLISPPEFANGLGIDGSSCDLTILILTVQCSNLNTM